MMLPHKVNLYCPMCEHGQLQICRLRIDGHPDALFCTNYERLFAQVDDELLFIHRYTTAEIANHPDLREGSQSNSAFLRMVNSMQKILDDAG